MQQQQPLKKQRMSSLKSFIHVDPKSHFPIQNLPYGIFSNEPNGPRRVGVAIGDFVVDLTVLARRGLFTEFDASCFNEETLNTFMSLGKDAWSKARAQLTKLLSSDEPTLRDDNDLQKAALLPRKSVKMHLPASIGDYTDFYSSREHATNVGTMFRGAENALQPNWLHLPVGYHGRASSVIVSGSDVRRPRGQVQKDNADPKQGSLYSVCRLLDYELEMVGEQNFAD